METPTAERSPGIEPVAVIDIGTSSIRMAIGEIHDGTHVRRLERLSQAISLGKDTFTAGTISRATIEESVRVLKSYRKILQEYDITRPDQIRVVGTSAVREALNRLAFLDRVYSATGFAIEPIDEAEVNRVTYLGLQPVIHDTPELSEAATVIAEVGGGSTDLLVVERENVLYSHTFRLGSIRLRETLEAHHAPKQRLRAIMENRIQRTVQEFMDHLNDELPRAMVTLGGDARFAASQLVENWRAGDVHAVPTDDLARFTEHVLSLTEDQLISQYHLTFADAETLGPALLTYVQLARAVGLKQLYVTDFNLRDALLTEMTVSGQWSDEFANQVFQSGIELGRKFQFDEPHGRHVAYLAARLFQALQDEHQLDARYGLLLRLAALLHEIGSFVNNRGHHKHSMYLISNSELFGLGKHDMRLIALVARYHRRASPKPTHELYMSLDRDSRIAVSKLSAILRIADSLDWSRSQRVREIECQREHGNLVISVPGVEDLSLEQLSLRQKGSLFEDTYGMQVLFRRGFD